MKKKLKFTILMLVIFLIGVTTTVRLSKKFSIDLSDVVIIED
jgi:hypothetical protein